MKIWAKLGNASAETAPIFTINIPFQATGGGINLDIMYLKRQWFSDYTTIGELFFNENPKRVCFTLEPTVRAGKDPRGIVAIPVGKYEVTTYLSPKHKMLVPLLKGVPGHTYVEIHIGNFERDSLDCILVGMERERDAISHSATAFELLMPKINESIAKGPLYLTISNVGGA